MRRWFLKSDTFNRYLGEEVLSCAPRGFWRMQFQVPLQVALMPVVIFIFSIYWTVPFLKLAKANGTQGALIDNPKWMVLELFWLGVGWSVLAGLFYIDANLRPFRIHVGGVRYSLSCVRFSDVQCIKIGAPRHVSKYFPTLQKISQSNVTDIADELGRASLTIYLKNGSEWILGAVFHRYIDDDLEKVFAYFVENHFELLEDVGGSTGK